MDTRAEPSRRDKRAYAFCGGAIKIPLLDRGFKARFSCVKTRWLDENWIGRELNESALAGLRSIREQNGLDLCGEDGEYHTLVTDGPRFTRGIDIRSYSKRVAGSLAYMEIHELQLCDHAV